MYHYQPYITQLVFYQSNNIEPYKFHLDIMYKVIFVDAEPKL